MTSALAAVYVARESPVARFLANPRALAALPYSLVTLATAFQQYCLYARAAFSGVTQAVTSVRARFVFSVAYSSTAPIFGVATSRLRRQLAAVTFNRHHLGAGRTRAGMAEQHALVTAFWLQELAAGLAAGMRNNPRLIQRIRGLFAEALVRSWNLILVVIHTAFWTCPDRCDSFSPFVAQTVVDPVQDAGHV